MKDTVLERALEQLDTDGGGPREGWEDCVLARIETPPAPRRARWPFVAAGSGLIAAAAAIALFVALRPAPDAPAPAAPPAANRAALDRLMRDIDRLEAQAQYEQALRAVTEAESAAVQTELDLAKRKQKAMGKALEGLKAKARKNVRDRAIVAKCDADDPLCAIE